MHALWYEPDGWNVTGRYARNDADDEHGVDGTYVRRNDAELRNATANDGRQNAIWLLT